MSEINTTFRFIKKARRVLFATVILLSPLACTKTPPKIVSSQNGPSATESDSGFFSFVPNRGQFAANVEFAVQGGDAALFLTRSGYIWTLLSPQGDPRSQPHTITGRQFM